MKTKLNNDQFMIRVLIVSSILMFLSFLTIQPKVIGVFMTLWVISVFLCLRLSLIGANIKLTDIESLISERSDEAKKNKNYFMKGVYDVTIPFIVVGLIFVVLILVAFFTIL